jgi:hypothetical protein
MKAVAIKQGHSREKALCFLEVGTFKCDLCGAFWAALYEDDLLSIHYVTTMLAGRSPEGIGLRYPIQEGREEVDLSLLMMAREGVEPPTPAFSVWR